MTVGIASRRYSQAAKAIHDSTYSRYRELSRLLYTQVLTVAFFAQEHFGAKVGLGGIELAEIRTKRIGIGGKLVTSHVCTEEDIMLVHSTQQLPKLRLPFSLFLLRLPWAHFLFSPHDRTKTNGFHRVHHLWNRFAVSSVSFIFEEQVREVSSVWPPAYRQSIRLDFHHL